MSRSWVRSHLWLSAVSAVLAVALVGFGVYWFAPHRLVLDRRVNEALPSSMPRASSDEPSRGSDRPGHPETSSGTDGRTTLASGMFRSLEHGTSGRAVVVELADGRRFLRLEDLDTSNGPDLRVYLTDRPLSNDWYVWDDGRIVDLGGLKGNVGDSNYLIPAEVELSVLETAVVWCRRFTVGFGVAPLRPS